jgi:hypothetical protein
MTEFHLLVLISAVMLLIGATARSYRSLVVQTLAVTLCFVAVKRYVLGVSEHVAPEVLGPFLSGVAAGLKDFVTFLIWSSVWWGISRWWHRGPHQTIHERARQKISNARDKYRGSRE